MVESNVFLYKHHGLKLAVLQSCKLYITNEVLNIYIHKALII